MRSMGVIVNGEVVEGMAWDTPLEPWEERGLRGWARQKWGTGVTLRELTPAEIESMKALGRYLVAANRERSGE
jgi:hypothetical protein